MQQGDSQLIVKVENDVGEFASLLGPPCLVPDCAGQTVLIVEVTLGTVLVH